MDKNQAVLDAITNGKIVVTYINISDIYCCTLLCVCLYFIGKFLAKITKEY